MKKKTLKALNKAIEIWTRRAEAPGTIDTTPCPLCERFNSFSTEGCIRLKSGGKKEVCPVSIKTGERSCHDTPFYEDDSGTREIEMRDFLIEIREEQAGD